MYINPYKEQHIYERDKTYNYFATTIYIHVIKKTQTQTHTHTQT